MNKAKHILPLLLSLIFICSLWAAEDASHSASLPKGGPAVIERLPDADPSRFVDYLSRLQNNVKIAPDETRPVVLCIGSSSFRMWDAQKALPEFKVLNFGFGGSRFSDVNALWSYFIPPVDPDYVLVYEGDNDVAVGKSAFQVFEDFLEVMGRLQAEFPESKILIVPVKPSPKRMHYWAEAEKVNAAIQHYAESRENIDMVVDANDDLLDDEGLPHAHLYSDGIHFTEAGYAVWNAAIRASLLK